MPHAQLIVAGHAMAANAPGVRHGISATMDEAGSRNSEEPTGAAQAEPRDGLISFSGYSDVQLNDLKYTLDQHRFPKNFQNLLAEILRRGSQVESPVAPGNLHAGRFTVSDGLRGWIQAKRIRSPVYGAGSIEIKPDEVVLNGWQRTWLGAPLQVQAAFPTHSIRNVAQDNGLVRFEIKPDYRLAARMAFNAESSAAAVRLVAQLPTATTPGFEQQWIEIRNFNSRLRAVGQLPVVAPAIVALNILVYITMCVALRQWGGFALQTLMNWGANFGTLTVNGQWWRLASATFVHFSLAHLLLNMWALWNIGRLCERLFGRLTLAFLYGASGALAGLSSIVWNPALSSLGASGAIFGVFGAFLAFYLKPQNRVPKAIARRHWISTSAFALFNLINGALQPGIDNAAHVGGLVGGFALGWILARPLGPRGREPLNAGQYAGTVALMAAIAVGAIWQVKGIGSELTVPEKYVRSHADLINGEAGNLRLWSELAARAAAGSISDLELGERFERDILPFWQSQHSQIDKENRTIQGPQRSYALLVADFVNLRYEWAQKIIEALKQKNPKLTAEAAAFVQKSNLAQARLERVEIRAMMDHRPRALVNNPAIAKVRNFLTGHMWKCIGAPSVWEPIPIPTDDPQDGPAARHAVGCLAQRLFMSADYRTLDSLMSRYAGTLADLPDGGSHYAGLINGLHDLFFYGGMDIPQLLGRTADWRRSVRTSLKPDLMEALIFEASAWSVRGHGTADSISTQSWAMFAYRTEMAAASLTDTKSIAKTDPAWYQASLNIGLDQGLGADRLRSIFNEGVAGFPAYRPLENRMLRILMPRWGGSYENVDQFISDMDRNTGHPQAFARYSELYSEYAALEGDDVDLFSATQASWSEMRSGYDELVKEHPASDIVLNRFAAFACRAGDREQYAALRDSLRKRISSVAWSGTYTLEYCDKKFAGTESIAARAGARSAESGPGPIVSLGGMRLGMTAKELLHAKGSPIARAGNYWTYNTIDSRHNGVLTAAFAASGTASDARVVAIEFVGDEQSSPSELPYLNGSSEDDLHERYGSLIGMGSPSEGVTVLRFRNGVYADTRNGRVFQYGIYAVKLPN